MFDESPDKSGRKIVNFKIGELTEKGSKKPFLIETMEMENVNRKI